MTVITIHYINPIIEWLPHFSLQYPFHGLQVRWLTEESHSTMEWSDHELTAKLVFLTIAGNRTLFSVSLAFSGDVFTGVLDGLITGNKLILF